MSEKAEAARRKADAVGMPMRGGAAAGGVGGDCAASRAVADEKDSGGEGTLLVEEAFSALFLDFFFVGFALREAAGAKRPFIVERACACRQRRET